MSLNSTKYPNNIRTVTGTPQLFPDDVILQCDTTLGPVTINLLDIPANNWNTPWRLYVVDTGANSSANNITINAGVGQTINGLASIVINQDDASVIVRIVDNAKFFGIFSYSAPIPVDTGWLDLNGFSWVAESIRPQYRVIDKQLIFRRTLIVPLEKGGAAIPYNGSASYEPEVGIAPYTGAGGGVTLNSAGLITFNQGNPVLKDASHYPDANYTTNWVIGSQRRNADPPVSASYLAYYTGVFLLQITTGGVMRAITLKNVEEGFSNQQIGQSALRYLTAQSIQTQTILDYRNITDSVAGVSTIVGRSNIATPNDANFIGLNSDTATHLITHDPSEEDETGGYVIPLDTLKAYLS